MIAISDADLLTVWEAAQGAHPVARPAELLRAAGNDHAAQWPIGVRDRRLLQLRERWFGSRYETTADCPACGLRVELTFDTPPSSEAPATSTHLAHGDLEIEYRLPDTNDLLALVDCATIEDARARLAERCIVAATRDVVPEDVIDALSDALGAHDPDGELRVAIACPDCGHEWSALFDPAAQLWADLKTAALRVLRDIDALAAAYGWTEREILSLSPVRRAIYLRMVTS